MLSTTPLERSQDKIPTAQAPLLKVGIYSLLVNLTLVGVKVVLAIISGSLALRAEAIHSFVDVFVSIALITGLLISARKSKRFPYGLYKVENVVSVIISLLLFLATYEIVSQAITGETVAAFYGWWVLGVVGALVLVPFLFSRYEKSVGKKFNSPSLMADASHFKADVLSASVVFLALVGQRFGLPLDRIAAGIVALFIVKAGWELLVSSMRVLLDASIDRATLEQIRSVIQAEPAVSTVENVTARSSGRFLFVEAIVTLRLSVLERAHLVSHYIESKIKETVPNVDRVLIHYEPVSKTQLRYAVALANSQGEISQRFGESPYFALVDIDLKEKRQQGQEIVANPYLELTKGKGIKIAQFLLSYKPDIMAVGESLSGKGPGFAFAEAGVETVQTEARSLVELVDQLVIRLNQP